MSKTETPKTFNWKDQSAENKALLQKGIRGEPLFSDDRKNDTPT